MQKIQTNKDSKNIPGDNSTKERMLMEIIKFLDTPYKYGGNSKNGIDCSAFTQAIFQNTFSVALLRSARDQYTQGSVIDNREGLKFGDLIFFNTRRRVRPGHVGIYIGDNLFAHSSSKNGVIVSSLDLDYYSKRFMGGRRLDGLLGSQM
jgi:lipoprotein Spr